jgi:hypothetical protein
VKVLANTRLLSRCCSAFASEAHLEYKARASHSLHPTALRARKSAAKPALWLALWRRPSHRTRAAGELGPLCE